MTTELSQQITNITHEVRYKYGDNYAEQFNEAINDVYNNLNIKTSHVLVDFVEYVISDDYKQPQINALKKENKEIKERVNKIEKENKELKAENKELKAENKELKAEIKELKAEIKELKSENKELKAEIKELKDDKQKFDALVRLHECNALVNKEFKRLYKIKFNKSKYDNNIPNIGDFIREPPIEDDKDDYTFWLEFNKLYPHSDDANFRLIYQQIANDRADSGAHVNVRKLNESDFDKLMELVYPEDYNANKQLYEQYRDWIFMFPV